MLEEAGYDVQITEDGAVAQNIHAPLPDLMLLDIWMSGMNGKDICKGLKSSAKTKHIPVILVSATKNIEQIAHDAGADDYISKPFQMDNLLAVVARHIDG